jgi:hypothetical protein
MDASCSTSSRADNNSLPCNKSLFTGAFISKSCWFKSVKDITCPCGSSSTYERLGNISCCPPGSPSGSTGIVSSCKHYIELVSHKYCTTYNKK